MTSVTVTQFRKDLFSYIDRVAKGETIILLRNNLEVARLSPTARNDWRQRMPNSAELLTTPDALLEPLDDVWDAYL